MTEAEVKNGEAKNQGQAEMAALKADATIASDGSAARVAATNANKVHYRNHTSDPNGPVRVWRHHWFGDTFRVIERDAFNEWQSLMHLLGFETVNEDATDATGDSDVEAAGGSDNANDSALTANAGSAAGAGQTDESQNATEQQIPATPATPATDADAQAQAQVEDANGGASD